MNKSTIIFVCIITFLLSISGCMVAKVKSANFQEIPKFSTGVYVTVQGNVDSLMITTSKILARDGWSLNNDYTIKQTIGQPKSIGGGTLLKPNIFFEQVGDSAKALFTGEWGLNQEGQIAMTVFARTQIKELEPIQFLKTGTTKADVAFQYLRDIAGKINNGIISYKISKRLKPKKKYNDL